MEHRREYLFEMFFCIFVTLIYITLNGLGELFESCVDLFSVGIVLNAQNAIVVPLRQRVMSVVVFEICDKGKHDCGAGGVFDTNASIVLTCC